MNNPLLHIEDLPSFTNIREESIQPAIEEIIADNLAEIDRLLQQPTFTWENLIDRYDEELDSLARALIFSR